ncbi:hypothetical protein ACHAWF_012584, partial [Thalassiosira exigua]
GAFPPRPQLALAAAAASLALLLGVAAARSAKRRRAVRDRIARSDASSKGIRNLVDADDVADRRDEMFRAEVASLASETDESGNARAAKLSRTSPAGCLRDLDENDATSFRGDAEMEMPGAKKQAKGMVTEQEAMSVALTSFQTTSSDSAKPLEEGNQHLGDDPSKQSEEDANNLKMLQRGSGAMKDAISTLTEEKDDLATQLGEAKLGGKEKDEKIASLNATLASLRQDVELKDAEIDKLRMDLEAAQGYLDDATIERDGLEAELSKARDLRRTLRDMASEKRIVRERVCALENNERSLLDKAREQLLQIETLMRRVDAAEKAAETCEAERDELESENKMQRARIEALVARIDCTSRGVGGLRDELEEKELQANDRSSKLAVAESEKDAALATVRNLASELEGKGEVISLLKDGMRASARQMRSCKAELEQLCVGPCNAAFHRQKHSLEELIAMIQTRQSKFAEELDAVKEEKACLEDTASLLKKECRELRAAFETQRGVCETKMSSSYDGDSSHRRGIAFDDVVGKIESDCSNLIKISQQMARELESKQDANGRDAGKAVRRRQRERDESRDDESFETDLANVARGSRSRSPSLRREVEIRTTDASADGACVEVFLL